MAIFTVDSSSAKKTNCRFKEFLKKACFQVFLAEKYSTIDDFVYGKQVLDKEIEMQ